MKFRQQTQEAASSCFEMNRVRVLVVDDSALVRKVMSEILNADPGIEVIGTASDPFDARDKIKELSPDVLTLDVEMPRMDGVTFLRNLMRLHPMPVVMVSTLTQRGAATTLDALSIGAVDFVEKPRLDLGQSLDAIGREITDKVKAAATANVGQRANSKTKSPASTPATGQFRSTNHLVAIGASTGGTEAIREVLVSFPADSPPIVIVQHIPEAFSGPYAERMETLCAISVCEAEDGQAIEPGTAYIAPGGSHLEIAPAGPGRFRCKVHEGPLVNRHRPAVDVLFDSVAKHAGPNAVGVILTGMGNDGAVGMQKMQAEGAPTIAQDEESSVVWGMPGSAVKLGAADRILPLSRIAHAVMSIDPTRIRRSRSK